MDHEIFRGRVSWVIQTYDFPLSFVIWEKYTNSYYTLVKFDSYADEADNNYYVSQNKTCLFTEHTDKSKQ